MLKSQQYSTYVFDQISTIDRLDSAEAVSYRSLCKGAGGLFRTVGLVQFMTYIKAKGDKQKHYTLLFEHLCTELCKIDLFDPESQDLLTEIRSMDLQRYMHTSRVVLGLLEWHKRLSEIMVTKEETSS